MEEEIGKVVNYYSKIGVAAIEITNGELKIGDTIRFKGATTDFTQKIESMQIEKKPVEKASAGASVGIKVNNKVRINDKIYKIIE
ncbi:MAG: EF-Tu/IF-2/RF-3 family GTPase [Candidatus Bathyarchaeia archaeon]